MNDWVVKEVINGEINQLKVPDNEEPVLVAYYQCNLYTGRLIGKIKYDILSYLPLWGHWNVKYPIEVVAWMPIPKLDSELKIIEDIEITKENEVHE